MHQEFLPQIAACIVATKVRYGVAIYGSVHLLENDPIMTRHRNLKVTLNNTMRVASGRKLSERVPIGELCATTKDRSFLSLATTKILSVLFFFFSEKKKNPIREPYVGEGKARTSLECHERRKLVDP